MTEKQKEFIDLIKYEGVDCKGFGIIAKLVTTDIDISIGAKALYAYFCSYCGNGTTAFPSRNKILSDLRFCEETYYVYLNELKNNGYIKVERSKKYPFPNTYIIVSRPPKLEKMKEENMSENNKLYVRGIKSMGYGTVPKAVMLDSRLHFKAKALYAYFCSFAGNGNTAIPSRNMILHHLQTTLNTFQRYLRQLIECNYIEVEQTKNNGRFANNVYYLNDLPDEEIGKKEIEKRSKIQAKKSSKIDKNINIKIKEKGSVDNNISTEDIHSTYKNINNELYDKTSNMTVIDYNKTKENNIDNAIKDRYFYEDVVKNNIEYDTFKQSFIASNDDISLNLFNAIFNLIIDTITSSQPFVRIKGQDLPQEVVKNKLLKLNGAKIDYVISCLKNVKTEIKNFPQYILTCLYNADTEDFFWHNQAKKDGLI